MTIACPSYVDVRIVNSPPDWLPVSVPGGAQLSFQQILVAQELGKPTVVCAYTNNKSEFAIHMLKRVFPPSYMCSVDKAGQRPWKATCVPKIKIN